MTRRRGRGEQGALLLILMIGVAVMSIALGAAVQAWSTTWRRDSEEELIFRGQQYVNAIMAYQKEHGGQYPLNLEDLFKPGPRRVRYIRKLFKDPIVHDGKWGLLYLMPGGRGVYDPKAAQKQAAKTAAGDWDDDEDANTPGGPQGGGLRGVTPLNQDPLGTGVTGAQGLMPGSLPAGAMPPGMGPPVGTWGSEEEAAAHVSEPPIGWPIVGVISRATGRVADKTYMVYKGHDKVDEWQFTVMDQLTPQAQVPGLGGTPAPFMGAGPGFGGIPAFTGIGNPGGPMPGFRNRLFPGAGGPGNNPGMGPFGPRQQPNQPQSPGSH